ncbi:protein of unknown function (plasmid) [Cupriavidus taiwanensis]|uniref:Uncharacterized protein n=1 Tax=Cupriavidus taiwanensis TaxID=164546 RepID=A0A7Z7JFB5_9BURK|nr:protein of unknown function [Cupriavidus taiwanensis]SOZ11997.1 protein of unknown function [Cupriavidus taiwanensis]SOZ43355.1 protein of unknown function [Cupriavidus taiwanensis]SPC22598.1 protein of unknown function [Cupriavidus taiwanensis]SPD54108.1 protein of unknown function [Cupriavidus taiwanensis]
MCSDARARHVIQNGIKFMAEVRGRCGCRDDAVDFVEAPALSRARERGANKRATKARRVARDNACERSDALRATAADLR